MSLPNPLEGQACGDRIGGPSRMALMLGESLVARGGLGEADITARYLAWFPLGRLRLSPGLGGGLRAGGAGHPGARGGAPRRERTGGLTAGVNAAHRATAIGCALGVIADDLVADTARREASLTHRHRDAGEASAATALLVRSLLRGASFAEAVELASSSVTGPTHELLLGALSADSSSLSVGGYAPRVVEAAVHFAATSATFADAIVRAIAFAGPSNYCPVLVGAFAAAHRGATVIPSCPIEPALRDPIERIFVGLTQAI